MPRDSACQSIFYVPTVRSLIGKQSECVWMGKFVFFCLRKAILFIDHYILPQSMQSQSPLLVAEQLWNIANHMMTTEVSPDEKKTTTCFIAEYLKDAHDFAALSDGGLLNKLKIDMVGYHE